MSASILTFKFVIHQYLEPGSNYDPGYTFGVYLQPGLRFLKPGLNRGNPGVKSNPDLASL